MSTQIPPQRRSGVRTALVASALLLALGTSQAAASFNVFARENSAAFTNNDIAPPATPLDTGLFFVNGQTLTVTASGLWNGGACGDVGPGGTSCFGDYTPGIPYFSLAGRIGATGAYFEIGSSFSGPVSGNGDLFLAFVDNDADNNRGFVTATVDTGAAAVPEPGTFALVIAALGMVGTVGRRRGGKPG